jgi:16S rRNA (cytosine1402-N4)-methyltransferase
LIGIDRDPAALAATRERLGDRIELIHGELGDIKSLIPDRVDGFVLDLGVSSPQLDVAARGFSFSQDGPLDMRMDPTRGPTALDLITETDADDLGELISELGEERHAKKIARMIKEAVEEDRVHTTAELAAICARAIPMIEQRKSKIHPATRTFQALRIAVNRELDQLAAFLAAFPDLLAPGGRCVAISFHSLEDRLVKQRFRELAWTSSLPPKLAAAAGERVEPVVEVLTRKAIFGSDDEVADNPRARSARLRACARTEAPNVPAGNAESLHRA